MATPYSTIFELFLTSVEDYMINKLEIPDIEVILTPFLIKSIPNFTNCKKDLEDRDDTLRVFKVELNTDEKVILSNLMRIEWLTKEINTLSQMRLHLQDGDFKTYSEAQGLNSKRGHLLETIEIVNKQILDYGYKNIDWSNLR